MNQTNKELIKFAKKQKAKGQKVFLCVEDNEQFTMTASSIEEARAQAIYYNASVICEVK